MQTNSAVQRLAEIDRDLIAVRLKTILDLCARGDVPGIAGYFTPDVVYLGGTWRMYPLNMRREGLQACAEMLRAIYVAYESLGSTINQLVIDGDSVALQRTTKLRNRGSGKTAPIEIWNYIKLRGGLICEYSEFPDTQAIASLDADD